MKIMDDLKVDRATPLGKLVVDSTSSDNSNSKQNSMTEADVKAAKKIEILIVD